VELSGRRTPKLGRRVAQARADGSGGRRYRGTRLLRLPSFRGDQTDEPVVRAAGCVRFRRQPRASHPRSGGERSGVRRRSRVPNRLLPLRRSVQERHHR
jgi:hypothetical protein